jgi:hypothetical protein
MSASHGTKEELNPQVENQNLSLLVEKEQKLNLSVGEEVLALDRLFGSKRAKKLQLLFKVPVLLPVLNCVALSLTNVKNHKAMLFNTLHKESVIWVELSQDRKTFKCLHAFTGFSTLETYCLECSGKITIDVSRSTSGCGINFMFLEASLKGEIIYRCEIIRLRCLVCCSKKCESG